MAELIARWINWYRIWLILMYLGGLLMTSVGFCVFISHCIIFFLFVNRGFSLPLAIFATTKIGKTQFSHFGAFGAKVTLPNTRMNPLHGYGKVLLCILLTQSAISAILNVWSSDCGRKLEWNAYNMVFITCLVEITRPHKVLFLKCSSVPTSPGEYWWCGVIIVCVYVVAGALRHPASISRNASISIVIRAKMSNYHSVCEIIITYDNKPASDDESMRVLHCKCGECVLMRMQISRIEIKMNVSNHNIHNYVLYVCRCTIISVESKVPRVRAWRCAGAERQNLSAIPDRI